MKIETSEFVPHFKPVVITLETQKEFNFLYGLLSLGTNMLKKNSNYFNDDLDIEMWQKMQDIKEENEK